MLELVLWLGKQLDEDERRAHRMDGDPTQALAEIDAKRQAIAHYLRVRAKAGEHLDYNLAEGAVSVQIKIMALPYSTRRGYLEEWRRGLPNWQTRQATQDQQANPGPDENSH